MAKRYVIRVVTEFSAAHVLHGYAGACNQIHGHNFTVEVEAVTSQLDDLGMGVDFYELRAATESITKDLDHRLLNDVAPFTDVNPTAENLAAYIHDRLGRELPAIADGRVTLRAVTIRENGWSSVTYGEDA